VDELADSTVDVTDSTGARAGGTGSVLLTLSAGQFVMGLELGPAP
jgi:hypothetical protein